MSLNKSRENSKGEALIPRAKMYVSNIKTLDDTVELQRFNHFVFKEHSLLRQSVENYLTLNTTKLYILTRLEG